MQVSARASRPALVKRRMNQYFKPAERRYCFHAQVLRRWTIGLCGGRDLAENFFDDTARGDAAEFRLRIDAQAMRDHGNSEFLDVIRRDKAATVIKRESLSNFHQRQRGARAGAE